MDANDKREILDAFNAAIAAFDAKSAERHQETRELVEKVAADQFTVLSRLDGLTLRVEALEASRAAHEARLAGQDRAITDGVAEAKRTANDARVELDGTLAGVEQRYEELAGGVNELRGGVGALTKDVGEMKTNIDRAVLRSLASHVKRIEEAADKLTRTPQVRTAASIGGAFAGSASVAAVFEILKALHIL